MNPTFSRRCNKLRKLFRSAKIDALLVTDPLNVGWLTGFRGGDSYLLVGPETQTLLSDSRYTVQIGQECPGLDYVLRGGGVGFADLVDQVLGRTFRSSPPRLGVESLTITLALATKIQERCGRPPVPTSGLVESLRSIKSREEVAVIRESGRIAGNAFRAVTAALRPDATESDVAAELEFLMRRLGAEGVAFPTIVAVGEHASKPHAIPGNTRVAEAGTLLIDWGALWHGYCSDMTRVVVTGRPPARFRERYEAVLDAQLAAIDAIRPGAICSDIHQVAVTRLQKAGLDMLFTHGLGHSLGRYIHEGPNFNATSDAVLKPGMVLTVEPGVYLDGWGGIRIEDDVLVTATGCEALTSVGKSWSEIQL